MHYTREWRKNPPKQRKITRCIADDPCSEWGACPSGLCKKHDTMLRVYGRTYKIRERNPDGWINDRGYVVLWRNGKEIAEHIYLAEKALGKPLPKGAEVHHVNKKPWDNYTAFNLVICPNREYHLLLHRRAKELGYEDN